MSEPEKPEEPTFPKQVIGIEAIVAARDKMPYVRIMLNDEPIAQLTVGQARNIAADIVQAAARIEADAMIIKFFENSGFPMEAAGALMVQFRDFRMMLDEQEVERNYSKPTTDTAAKADTAPETLGVSGDPPESVN